MRVSQPGLFARVRREASCRRSSERTQIETGTLLCWAPGEKPERVTSIELDTRGARIVLPWNAQKNDTIQVSVSDELGQYQTIEARVAWVQELPKIGRSIAGLAFSQELNKAA